MGGFTKRLVPEQFEILSASIADNDYVFPLSDDTAPRSTNILEYFYFVDNTGDIVVATAGTIKVLASPDNNATYQTLHDSAFDAVDATLPSRTKPSGRGRATHIKFTLAGIVATGAVGFKTLLTQEL